MRLHAILDSVAWLRRAIRREAKRAMRLALLATLCWGVSVQDGHACGCTVPQTPPRAAELRRDVDRTLGSAFAVFFGEPIARNFLTVRFRVDAVWKGDLGAEVVMATGNEALPGGRMMTNTCDPRFPFGQTYLVFAYGTTPETMKAESCLFIGTPYANLMSVLDDLVGRRSPSPSVVPRALVAVVGNVARPGLVEWRDGLTADEAISLAGGPVSPIEPDVARSVDSKSSIVRMRAGVSREVFPAPPTAVLLPDDQLVVGLDFARK